jgi:hypothetical protein
VWYNSCSRPVDSCTPHHLPWINARINLPAAILADTNDVLWNKPSAWKYNNCNCVIQEKQKSESKSEFQFDDCKKVNQLIKLIITLRRLDLLTLDWKLELVMDFILNSNPLTYRPTWCFCLVILVHRAVTILFSPVVRKTAKGSMKRYCNLDTPSTILQRKGNYCQELFQHFIYILHVEWLR